MMTITLDIVLTPAKEEELQRRITYFVLYALAAAIDARLKRGHLRDCRGRAIVHFDEWLRAAEAGEWTVENGRTN